MSDIRVAYSLDNTLFVHLIEEIPCTAAFPSEQFRPMSERHHGLAAMALERVIVYATRRGAVIDMGQY